MLMDILMEALMSMDDESLDYVLESCDAEELEIISDAMEARYEDGPTKQAPDITAELVHRNVGTNMKSRGDFGKHDDDREIYENKQAKLTKALNTIVGDKQASKRQGKENARAIRAADLKSKLLTGKPIDEREKDKILSGKQKSPAYRYANFKMDNEFEPHRNTEIGYQKQKDMAKARRLRGGVTDYLMSNK